MSCPGSQEAHGGFCHDICPSGYSGYGGLCLENCPIGFIDHGTVCEPPTMKRSVANVTLQPCKPGQVDRNGDCFEPHAITLTVINGEVVPKQIGCGCIRQTLAKRLQCPLGYTFFNNSCVSQCEKGYNSIVDSVGNISSLYCQALCPENPTSQTRWKKMNNLCVKNYFSRIKTSIVGNQKFSEFSTPENTLSYLSTKPLGSGVNERSPFGLSPQPAATDPLDPSSWLPSWLSPKYVYIIIGLGILFLFYPIISSIISSVSHIILGVGTGIESTVKGAGSGIGNIASGIGNVASGVGNVVEGASSAVKGTLDVIGTTEQNIADQARKFQSET